MLSPPQLTGRARALTWQRTGVSCLQAFIIAVVQGVTELFPVSSLGHSVLIPAWIGGSWQTMVTQSSARTAVPRRPDSAASTSTTSAIPPTSTTK
jgi:hypothetical protein